jgi:hypothetical protein
MTIIITINLTKVRIYIIMITRNKYSSKVHYNEQYRRDELSATSYISGPDKQKDVKSNVIIFEIIPNFA